MEQHEHNFSLAGMNGFGDMFFYCKCGKTKTNKQSDLSRDIAPYVYIIGFIILVILIIGLALSLGIK